MWLASVSLRSNGELVPAADWTRGIKTVTKADSLINRILDGRGLVGRQRAFRMSITLCRHRVLSAEEKEYLPPSFRVGRARDIAGGPVAALWSIGIPDVPSVQPCRDMGKQPIEGLDRRFFIPKDCGYCEPCLARAAVDQMEEL